MNLKNPSIAHHAHKKYLDNMACSKNWGERLNLRHFNNEDLPFLQKLYGSTRQQELAITRFSELEKEQFIASQFSAQHHYYCQNYSTQHFDIVELDKTAIGRLFVDYREHEIRIVDIALMQEHRQQGIATFLFSCIFQEAKKNKLSVTIHVERNNPARRLYKRLGFQVKKSQDEVYLLLEWNP